MEFNVEKVERIIEPGDIFVTDDNRIRMIISDDNMTYYAINLYGEISSCPYDNIDELVDNYCIKEFYKNNELKIVKRED